MDLDPVIAIPADLAPESRDILRRLAELGLSEFSGTSVQELRDVAKAERPLMGEAAAVGGVQDLEIPSGDGVRRIAIRLYSPLRPVRYAMLWMHGGGWVMGDLEHSDVGCRALSLATDALVVSVDYRLAPENPFPAGLHDAFQALTWLDDQLANPETNLPLVVGGDSAGGNLAAALCRLSNQRGGPTIDHQLLLYPVLDCDFESTSYQRFGRGYGLTRELMERFFTYYVGHAGHPADPLVAGLRATDFGALPSATVVLAGCDVLYDEGEAYALRLRKAGVPAAILKYRGQMHGFWSYAGVSDISRVVNRDILTCLSLTLRRVP